MARCKTCKKSTGFLGNDECKECEKIRLDIWVKNHTFIFNERVMIPADDFYPNPRFGIVIKKGCDVEGSFGYYSTAEWYDVKMEETREVLRCSPVQLEKIKNE